MFQLTNNPIKDAESYQQNIEEENAERDFIPCDICGRKIYRADVTHYGDDVWDLDGMDICEDCIDDYIQRHRRQLK